MRQLFQDERGQLSSKRTIGLFGAMALIGMYVLYVSVQLLVAWHNHVTPAAPDPTLSGIIAALVFSCLGLTSVDKFSPQAKVEAEVTMKRVTAQLQAIPEGPNA